jgi:hypothetical protein
MRASVAVFEHLSRDTQRRAGRPSHQPVRAARSAGYSPGAGRPAARGTTRAVEHKVSDVPLKRPAVVHGSASEQLASPGCSDATIRRRLKEWAAVGLGGQVHTLALRAHDRMIALELDDPAADGCITKAPGGEAAGRRWIGGSRGPSAPRRPTGPASSCTSSRPGPTGTMRRSRGRPGLGWSNSTACPRR